MRFYCTCVAQTTWMYLKGRISSNFLITLKYLGDKTSWSKCLPNHFSPIFSWPCQFRSALNLSDPSTTHLVLAMKCKEHLHRSIMPLICCWSWQKEITTWEQLISTCLTRQLLTFQFSNLTNLPELKSMMKAFLLSSDMWRSWIIPTRRNNTLNCSSNK